MNTNDAIEEMAKKPEKCMLNKSMVNYCDDLFHHNKALYVILVLDRSMQKSYFNLVKLLVLLHRAWFWLVHSMHGLLMPLQSGIIIINEKNEGNN